ncbi:hypothetical protein G7074_15895 [Pedobacter sp. HDW13]|uniref:HNH endonuclease n=1 Tax=Pedobacter sp. HDW13 TaxID=2714940 RepID=UPI001409C539|nr:hypothetical protein [Pedobacter sp. HDW13]QIL40617.1 hypothetical protein G7074_15895 [Pedobacter sp. HDW13]
MNLSKIYPYLIDFSAENLKKKSVNFQSEYKLINPFVKQLNSIFNYKWFNSNTNVIYSSYKLCQKLDRYTCTYCNRSYTSTVITEAKKTVIRPTLDHWFPESKFPLLAISFYNLIPSCSSCNSSVKGAGIQLLNKYIHPYVDQTQSEDFEFDYGYTSLRGFRIFVNDTSNGNRQGFKAKNTIEAMYIDEVYNSNISELRDMITIQRNYSLGYIDKMQKMLRSKMSKEEVYRLLFGVIYDQNNFHKRPLSKFKKDILKKLGMLAEM